MKSVFTRINELEKKIKKLPKGSISNKTINGNERFYLQWSENGEKNTLYLKEDEINKYREEIKQRKVYEREVKELKATDIFKQQNLLLEEKLPLFVQSPLKVEKKVLDVQNFKTRDCYKKLDYYFASDIKNKVCILNGLRRTGKTTLIFQYLLNMNDDNYSNSCYLLMSHTDSMEDLIKTINKLQMLGFKYIFIDEITLVKDFINSAHLISDMYCCDNNKIVLSGTDSLGFWISNTDTLYDRNFMIHTTYISFAEHSKLLGTNDIDNYIEYGGTLTLNKDYNTDTISTLAFSDKEQTEIYINTAICKNIQNSLELYKDSYEYSYIYELYRYNELTNAINRIIEDISHRFIVDVIIRDFKSKDLHSASNLLKNSQDQSNRIDLLSEIDEEKVTKQYMDALSIMNLPNQKVKITDNHLKQIKEFLKHLDLIADLEIVRVNLRKSSISYGNYDLISQPGLIYSQVINLIDSLNKDEKFNSLSPELRNISIKKIKSDVLGRLLEDIVILDCKHKLLNNHKVEVFQINFGIGEFDMVIWDHSDEDDRKCYLYEIKHSKKIVEQQTQHLCNEDFLDYITNEFGTIVKRCVLYRGEDFVEENGIEYQNVCSFLKKDLPLL